MLFRLDLKIMKFECMRPFDLTRKCVKNIWCCWNVYVFHELTVACLLFWCCYFRERSINISSALDCVAMRCDALHDLQRKALGMIYGEHVGFVLLWHAILACTNLSVAQFNLISRKQIGQPVFVDAFQNILTPWNIPSKWPTHRQMSNTHSNHFPTGLFRFNTMFL